MNAIIYEVSVFSAFAITFLLAAFVCIPKTAHHFCKRKEGPKQLTLFIDHAAASLFVLSLSYMFLVKFSIHIPK